MDKIDKEIKNFIAGDRVAKKLFPRMQEADKEVVPEALLARVRSQISRAETVNCPYCQKPITPFKKPLSRQKLLNFLWLAAGIGFFLFSFVIRQYFIQWVALGVLCFLKWIVDQKATKTQILIYKALSESGEEKTRHLHRTDSHL